MMTRRGVLLESLKFTGLLAGAAFVAGCGDESGSTGAQANKPTPEQEAEAKSQQEATEKYFKEQKSKKK